jgi:hypothetical protein
MFKIYKLVFDLGNMAKGNCENNLFMRVVGNTVHY